MSATRKGAGLISKWAVHIIRRHEHQRILDLDTSVDGWGVRTLRRLGFEATGTSGDPEIVRLLRTENMFPYGLKELRMLPDRSFDLVVACELEDTEKWLPDAERLADAVLIIHPQKIFPRTFAVEDAIFQDGLHATYCMRPEDGDDTHNHDGEAGRRGASSGS